MRRKSRFQIPGLPRVPSNWIADRNRYGLPEPPAFVLTAFHNQDAALVLVPSNQQRKYLLARRRTLSRDMSAIVRKTRDGAAATLKQLPRFAESDSAMLERLDLVLVDSITHVHGNVANGSWMRSLPGLLAELRARDTWATGGADKLTDRLEAAERATEDRDRATLHDNIEHRARDAWRSLQARTGQRNQRASSGRAKIVPTGRL